MAPVLGVILWVQLAWRGRISGQTMPLTVFSADLTRFFIPGLTELVAIPALISPVTSFLGTLSQAGVYIGLPYLALLVLAWRYRIGRPWLGGITVALVVAAVLSLGPVLHVWGHAVGLPLPGAILTRLPLFRELVPDWFGIYLGLGVALAVAIVLDRSAASPTLARWVRPLAIIGLVSWLPFALPVSTTLVPAVFKTTALGSGAVVAFGPADSSNESDSPMLWQAVADFDFSTIGAYRVGRDFADDYPGELPPFERAMVELQQGRETWSQALRSRQRVTHELAADRVTLVVVGPMPHETAAVHFVSALLKRSGRRKDGVWVWHLAKRR
jgi:dolichyl-phosphate beta-glucosyltransferase